MVAAAAAAGYSRNRARLMGKQEDNSAVEGDLVLTGRTGRAGGWPLEYSIWEGPRNGESRGVLSTSTGV